MRQMLSKTFRATILLVKIPSSRIHLQVKICDLNMYSSNLNNYVTHAKCHDIIYSFSFLAHWKDKDRKFILLITRRKKTSNKRINLRRENMISVIILLWVLAGMSQWQKQVINLSSAWMQSGRSWAGFPGRIITQGHEGTYFALQAGHWHVL